MTDKLELTEEQVENIDEVEKKANWFTHILTDKTNENYDHSRVLTFIAFIFALICEGWVVYKSDTFDIMVYSTGIGVLLAASAAGAGIRSKTES